MSLLQWVVLLSLEDDADVDVDGGGGRGGTSSVSSNSSNAVIRLHENKL